MLGIDAGTGGDPGCWPRSTTTPGSTLVPGLPARTSSGTLLTSADTGGTRRLMAGGQPVTPPGLQLDEVLAVDGETVLFTASDEPAQTHVWAYDPVGRAAPPEHGARGAPRDRAGGHVVLVSSTPGRPGPGPPCGGSADAGAGRRRRSARWLSRPVLQPRAELLTLGPRELRAALFLPSWHQPGDPPLPVLMDPYGGPAMRKVTAGQASWTLRVAVVRRAGLRGARGGRPRHPRPRARLGTGDLPGYRRAGAGRPGGRAASRPPGSPPAWT